MPGYSKNELEQLIIKLQKHAPQFVIDLGNAVKRKPFSYGTAGKKGGALRLGGIMADSINNRDLTQSPGLPADKRNSWALSKLPTDTGHASAFQSGARQGIQRKEALPMMDHIYGDGFIGDRADASLIAFMRYAVKIAPLPWDDMALQGHQLIGDPKLQREFHPFQLFAQLGINEGWNPHPITTAAYGNDEFRNLEMTATKELSRVVRWLVGHFGGSIYLDGKDVYYGQVFHNDVLNWKGEPAFGDTELEMRDLFQYFSPGKRSGTYGKGGGSVHFFWDSEPMEPSKLLFATSWRFDVKANDQWYKKLHVGNFESALAGLVTKAYRSGERELWTVMAHEFQVAAAIQAVSVQNSALWNNFTPLPSSVRSNGLAKYLNDLGGQVIFK
jgi:hypothetical protein